MLFVVDLAERKQFRSAPQNVAFEKDFHTITTPGQAPDVVEAALSRLEAEVAPALTRIIKSQSLADHDDAMHVFFFLTMLLVKNPAQRNVFDAFTDELMNRVGKIEASNQRLFEEKVRRQVADGAMPEDTDIEGLRQAILNENFKVSLSTESHLDLEFTVIPKLLPLVADREWILHRALDGHFVTCDRPAVLMWADPTRNDPIGLGLRETRLLFPLSSEIAICGGFELEERVIDVNAEQVAAINGRIILNAKRQVYAREDDFRYLLHHTGGVRLGSDLKDDDLAKWVAEENATR